MTRQQPPELFSSQRPVRSDFSRTGGRSDQARERIYARRRVITLCVLAVAILGGVYALWGRGPKNPADIPTIHAGAAYKQKPIDPGGIDIPHQDVMVYDQIENRNGNPSVPVEHLLPPPETPKDMPRAAVTPPVQQPTPAVAAQPEIPVPASAPEPVVSAAQPVPEILPPAPPKPVTTTVTSTPVAIATPSAISPPVQLAQQAAPVAAPPASSSLTIEQVIESTKATNVAVPAASAPAAAPVPDASGGVAIQLASVGSEAQAKTTMQNLQQKYAAQLGGVTLRLMRADLGDRGVFYRIQSQKLDPQQANHICSSLKQINAGCILVRQ